MHPKNTLALCYDLYTTVWSMQIVLVNFRLSSWQQANLSNVVMGTVASQSRTVSSSIGVSIPIRIGQQAATLRHDARRAQECAELDKRQLEGLEHPTGVCDEGVLAQAKELGDVPEGREGALEVQVHVDGHDLDHVAAGPGPQYVGEARTVYTDDDIGSLVERYLLRHGHPRVLEAGHLGLPCTAIPASAANAASAAIAASSPSSASSAFSPSSPSSPSSAFSAAFSAAATASPSAEVSAARGTEGFRKHPHQPV